MPPRRFRYRSVGPPRKEGIFGHANASRPDSTLGATLRSVPRGPTGADRLPTASPTTFSTFRRPNLLPHPGLWGQPTTRPIASPVPTAWAPAAQHVVAVADQMPQICVFDYADRTQACGSIRGTTVCVSGSSRPRYAVSNRARPTQSHSGSEARCPSGEKFGAILVRL